jgi:hybrid cluster-associated redox disulfide protein
MKINANITVDELVRHHPQTIDFFVKRKMLCVGCPAEAFHSLEDVAGNYSIEFKQLLKELLEAIDDSNKTRGV